MINNPVRTPPSTTKREGMFKNCNCRNFGSIAVRLKVPTVSRDPIIKNVSEIKYAMSVVTENFIYSRFK
tara:strand:+ start:1323 stop:1529 length:207 start_codon:yes stop_codon:yes gene_type:complete